ncbi:MFS transporter [Terrarubrum flagellatum]|uniref:MFS transporter n=1 Tax=Terrirubrum flagellatum TaxID=2895980 RepID=UPI0031451B04
MSNGKRIALIAAVYLGSFMALLDVSIVNLALPTLQASLKSDFAGLQWIINAYGLCLSSLTLSAGALGDRYGRKRCWLMAIALFVIGSLFCAAAQSLPSLIAGRIVQGIAGAALIPGALSILTQAFHDPKTRAHVIGGWAGFTSLSMIVGPALGGFLIAIAGWPSIFLINVPFGLLTIGLGLWAISESSDPDHASFDPAGQIVSAIWLGALSFGLINVGAEGWAAAATMAPLVIALVGFAVFVFIERRVAAPMLPRALMGDGRFVTINIASFALGLASYGSLFFFSMFLQDVQQLSPEAAGLRMTPLAIFTAVAATFSGRVSARIGLDAAMIAGFAIVGGAMGGMAFLEPGSSYALVGFLFGMLGVGIGFAIPAISAAAMIAAPRTQSGVASSVVNAGRQTGAMVGVALLGSLMSMRAVEAMKAALTRAGIASPADMAQAIVIRRDFSGAGFDAARGFLVDALQNGFRSAMIASALVAAAMAVALGVINARRLRSAKEPAAAE